MPVTAATSNSMAVEHASELAAVVASYLRKHGFKKTLSAFVRENGDASQEADVADLEALYKLYISTQADEASKVKKPRTTISENGPPSLDKDVRSDGENGPASPHTNGGISSQKKKKRKVDASVDLPVLDQTGKHADAAEANKTTNEEGSKKKKGGESIEGKHTKIEGLKSECEMAYSNGNAARSVSTLKENVMENHDADCGCPATQQELAHSRKSSSKKQNKKQECIVLQDKDTSKQQCLLLQSKDISAATKAKLADNVQVLSQNDDVPKKRRKKSKGSSCKEGIEDAAVAESALGILSSENASKQAVNGLEGGEIDAKKKKHRKEVSMQSAEGDSKEPSKSELEENQNEDIDRTKHHGKKRKVKECVNAGKNSDQDSSHLGRSPEKLKEVEGVADKDVEMHHIVDVKAKKKKKTPTGALAFKRVEVEKVTFLDPRLGDNSYWAKDGAEEGYGAKAQEVLGLVRGRDFRHEKTKKKRGSYRGGIIGLQSHSIKFDNSDEECKDL